MKTEAEMEAKQREGHVAMLVKRVGMPLEYDNEEDHERIECLIASIHRYTKEINETPCDILKRVIELTAIPSDAEFINKLIVGEDDDIIRKMVIHRSVERLVHDHFYTCWARKQKTTKPGKKANNPNKNQGANE